MYPRTDRDEFIETKIRNVLTHGYAKIGYSKLIEVLSTGLKDIEKLVRAVR
jgi:uncharacterized protein YutE (UPF0331/DUF86 family)